MFTSALLIFASAFALIFILINLYRDSKLRKLASRFPGPLSIPIVGDAYLFLGLNYEGMLTKFTELAATYPSPFRLKIGSWLAIVTYKPEEIKTILNSRANMNKPSVYDVAKPWAGNGLLTAPVSIWHNHRKIIQPAFNQKVLQTFVDVFQRQSIVLTDDIASNVNGEEFEISEIVAFRTLNFICESVMGSSTMSNKKVSQEYFQAIKTAMQVFVERTMKLWLHFDFIFNFTKLSKESESSIKIVHQVSNEVIQAKKKKIAESAFTKIPEECDIMKKKPFLDLMMSENKLSDTELREEVDTLMFAGYDTNSSASTFTLLMLASHPDIQDQVYEEIYNIYGSEDPKDLPVKPEDLNHLVILDRVIKETMRVFPIVPLVGRQVDEALKIGDYTLPKTSLAIISIWTLHRNENVWPDPLKFNPDRFLPEEVAKRHPYSYLPFSGGPRNCIGMLYAMMAMKVLLTTILRKYIVKKDNITPIEDMRLSLDILLRPVEPITIRLENRIKKNS